MVDGEGSMTAPHSQEMTAFDRFIGAYSRRSAGAVIASVRRLGSQRAERGISLKCCGNTLARSVRRIFTTMATAKAVGISSILTQTPRPTGSSPIRHSATWPNSLCCWHCNAPRSASRCSFGCNGWKQSGVMRRFSATRRQRASPSLPSGCRCAKGDGIQMAIRPQPTSGLCG